MICAGNDLLAQLLSEADFGGVVAVQGHAFYDAKKIAGELRVMRAANVRMGGAVFAIDGTALIELTEEGFLLRGCDVDEIFAENFIAAFVQRRRARTRKF